MADITGTYPSSGELQGVISTASLIAGNVVGVIGPKGDKGDRGDKGDTGVGVASTLLNSDYTLTITLTDGTSYTTPSIRGQQGQQGIQGQQGVKGDTGETGNGISSVTKTGTQGLVDTYTITFTDGTTTTFTVTNGQNGTGSVSDVWVNGTSVLDGNTAKVIVPTKVSDLTNDSGFVEETDLADVATTGDYDDLTDTPTNVSDFTNDADYQTGLQVQAALTAYKNVYRIDLPSFSSLPLTFSNSKITADHEIINSVLGTPSAQTSDWTLTPTAGSATLSGSISGSTTLTLYIAEVESLTVT